MSSSSLRARSPRCIDRRGPATVSGLSAKSRTCLDSLRDSSKEGSILIPLAVGQNSKDELDTNTDQIDKYVLSFLLLAFISMVTSIVEPILIIRSIPDPTSLKNHQLEARNWRDQLLNQRKRREDSERRRYLREGRLKNHVNVQNEVREALRPDVIELVGNSWWLENGEEDEEHKANTISHDRRGATQERPGRGIDDGLKKLIYCIGRSIGISR